MSLTKTDLNQIEKIVDKVVDKKLEEKLTNYTSREEFQIMISAVDERFNKMDAKLEHIASKMLDKDTFNNLVDKLLHEIEENRIERLGINHQLEQHEAKFEKIEKNFHIDLAIS